MRLIRAMAEPTSNFGRKAFLLALLSGLTFFVLGFKTNRPDFEQLILLWTTAFFLYFFQYKLAAARSETFRVFIRAGWLFRGLFILSVPALSDDFYRFLWDGRLVAQGLNPFLQTPDSIGLPTDETGRTLFDNMNSRSYFSVYPPVLQGLFGLSVLQDAQNLLLSLAVLKILLLVFEGLNLIFLNKLIQHFHLSPSLVLLYWLNPLVLVEGVGNLHFEPIMLFGMLAALWFSTQNRWVVSGFAIAVGTGAKLIPFIFLPAILRFAGWKKGLLFFWGFVAFSLILWAPFFAPEIFSNIFSSLRLYYQNFEFNAGIYYLLRWIGFQVVGYNIIALAGKGLVAVCFLFILGLALRNPPKTTINLAGQMLVALTGFHLLATTVNPWYLIPLVGLSVFSPYRFALVWSWLIGFSYHAFRSDQWQESSILLWFQYVSLAGFLFAEWNYRRKGVVFSWMNRQRLMRAQAKWRILKPLLYEQTHLLDIGTGNGALAFLLHKSGKKVVAADIGNKSCFEEINPQILSENTLPFPDKSFDAALLITVLHHADKPRELLKEAGRVAKTVIVMEDVWKNPVQKWFTFLADSLVNNEWLEHSRSNLPEYSWEKQFGEMNFQVKEKIALHKALVFRQVVYVLQNPKEVLQDGSQRISI